MTATSNAIGLNGLTLDEELRYLAHVAEREAKAKRARLAIAAGWAVEHGRPCALDSKGWPLDENDQPLPPGWGCIAEMQTAYRLALAMAKTRETRRAKAAARTTGSAFDLSSLSLVGVSAHGSKQVLSKREAQRREEAEAISKFW